MHSLLLCMRENKEGREQALLSAVVSEAIRLAPKFDQSRGGGHIWQALKNLGIKDKGEQAQWFGRVKKQVDRELLLRKEVEEARREEHDERVRAEAIEHEREIDPEAHDKEGFQNAA